MDKQQSGGNLTENNVLGGNPSAEHAIHCLIRVMNHPKVSRQPGFGFISTQTKP